jgi:hypothetical protein
MHAKALSLIFLGSTFSLAHAQSASPNSVSVKGDSDQWAACIVGYVGAKFWKAKLSADEASNKVDAVLQESKEVCPPVGPIEYWHRTVVQQTIFGLSQGIPILPR